METPLITSKAHRLSEPYTIDPAYSAEGITPAPTGLSLYSSRKDGPYWLYNWGHLEVYLFNRMRHEAFLGCSYVDQPGRLRTHNPVFYARTTLLLQSLPGDGKVVVYHSGIVDFRVNNMTVLHAAGGSSPAGRTVDLLGHLKEGDNQVIIRVHRMDEPPALLLDSPFLRTDADWQVGCDLVVWHSPACFPYEGDKLFPHQEHLPSVIVRPREHKGEIYDFGVEVFGNVQMTAGGTGTVELHPGESLAEARNTEPKDSEQYLPPIDLSEGLNTLPENAALRYLRLVASPRAVIEDISISAPMFPTMYRGAFACGDERLNRIWMHSAYTFRLCMRELLVDAVKRDRLLWAGDLYLGILCNCFSFAEKDISHRSLTALYGDALEAVELNGIIDYSLYWVMALLEYVLAFGDLAYLGLVREWFYSLMRITRAKEDENGFLPSQRFHWIFVDWAQIDKDGISSCLQMIYVMALEAAGRLAELDGNTDMALHFSQRARYLRVKCRALFWSEKRGLFVDNRHNAKQGEHVSRHANFLAILSGTADRKQTQLILQNVLLNGNIAPVHTPYMTALECRALSRCRKKAAMLEKIRDHWGGMLDNGATTFWEAYDPSASGAEHYAFYNRPFGKSLCHMWSTGPIFLLSGDLSGLRPLESGWKRFTAAVEPMELDWMYVTVPTPYGNIEMQVEANECLITVPEGTTLEKKAGHGSIEICDGPCSVRYDMSRKS